MSYVIQRRQAQTGSNYWALVNLDTDEVIPGQVDIKINNTNPQKLDTVTIEFAMTEHRENEDGIRGLFFDVNSNAQPTTKSIPLPEKPKK